MAIDFSLPVPEQIEGIRSSSSPARVFPILRRGMGVAIPVLLDLCSIAVGCIVGILCYEVHSPLDRRSTGLLWAELFLKYGLAFVILARAHHLYTQRDTLLQVAETARILSVSVYSLIILSVGTYLTNSSMPRLLLTYLWVFTAVLLVVQKHTTSRFIRRTSVASDQHRVLICGTSREARRLFSYLLHTPNSGRIPIGFLDETGCDNRRVIYSHDYSLREHAPVISEPLSQYLFRSLDVQEIFVTSTVSQSRMNELLALATDAGVSVSVVGACHPYFAERCTAVQMFDGLMLTTFDSEGEPPLGNLCAGALFGGHEACASDFTAFAIKIALKRDVAG
jgi:FlaA1/EpsC-like NDP-sugar epimerase